MTRLGSGEIDRQLGEWLREESLTRAPVDLIEGVFTETSRTRQLRRWWPPVAIGGRRRGPRLVGSARTVAPWRGSALAGAMALVLVVIVVGLTLRPSGTGPGSSTGPSPSLPSPSAASPSSPAAATSSRTPRPTTLGTLAAKRLNLGGDAGPIDVTSAFGSIWVADIHANDVRRFEPDTMRELARIPVTGAAWFAMTEGALWVTNQMGTGLSRIDPATNTVVAHVGDAPTCGAPIVAFASLWQAACDADVILRIDPSGNSIVDTLPAHGHGFLVAARGTLITVGTEGLASLDPDTGVFTPIASDAAVGVEYVVSDGTTIWVKNSAGMARIDPATGRTIAGISAPDAKAISFAGGHGWLTVSNEGVSEIDLATNKVIRTIPALPAPLVPVEADGVLWVTDFDTSALWRIDL
jgi:DNA-binding beta-propeller fold protein YncE